MLYITTRDHKETFTSHRTLCANYAPDNGQFIPFVMPEYTDTELQHLLNKSFGEIVAEILNHFFSARLTGSDIDFAIGRNAVKLIPMNHKIVVSELWHNPGSGFTYTINTLYSKIIGCDKHNTKPTRWFEIAVRIAVLFGIYRELVGSDLLLQGQLVDISVPADDFSAAFAAFYAKQMGLPLGKIICTTDDSSALWDLIHRGNFTPDPACFAIQPGVEMLIHATLGEDEANKFSKKCADGRAYTVDEEQLPILNDGLFCSVASYARTEATINSVYRSNDYIIDTKTAFCYGGLQDYRAKHGDGRLTIILAESNPMDDANAIQSATGIKKLNLIDHINNT